MTKWEYITVPVLVHATKQILDNMGEDGWELVSSDPRNEPGEPRRLFQSARRRPDMPTPEERLADLGLTVPEVAKPVAAYVPAVRSGNHIYTAGQLPMRDGTLLRTGKVGRRGQRRGGRRMCSAVRSQRQSPQSARLSVTCRGSHGSSRSSRSSASAPDFTGQPGVANGASELIGRVFGDAGQHAPLRGRR